MGGEPPPPRPRLLDYIPFLSDKPDPEEKKSDSSQNEPETEGSPFRMPGDSTIEPGEFKLCDTFTFSLLFHGVSKNVYLCSRQITDCSKLLIPQTVVDG